MGAPFDTGTWTGVTESYYTGPVVMGFSGYVCCRTHRRPRARKPCV